MSKFKHTPGPFGVHRLSRSVSICHTPSQDTVATMNIPNHHVHYDAAEDLAGRFTACVNAMDDAEVVEPGALGEFMKAADRVGFWLHGTVYQDYEIFKEFHAELRRLRGE